MLHDDPRFLDAVAARVGALEKTTDAEIVVVAAPRSDAYADVAWRGTLVGCGILLAVLLFIPWTVGPGWLLIDLSLFALGLSRVLSWTAPLRVLTGAPRRRAAVAAAARRAFLEEAVHGTPNRTGVLVYVSALEGRVEVVPDLGVEGRVPRGAWVTAAEAFAHDDLDHFLAGLDALGAVLAHHLPHTPDSDAVDLPNVPRVRR